MPTLNIGHVVGPQGPTGATGPSGGASPADVAIAINSATPIAVMADDDRLSATDTSAGGIIGRITGSVFWTWIKSKLSTSGETITVNGPLILTSGTRPTSSGTGPLLAGNLITQEDAVVELMTEDIIVIPCMALTHTSVGTSAVNNGWTITNVGSGVNNANGPSSFRMQTGVTAASSSLARANSSASLGFGKGTVAGSIPWSRKIRISFEFVLTSATADSIARFQVGEAYNKSTVSDLDQRGVGVKIENTSVKLLAHNGTLLTTSATLATITDAGRTRMHIVSDGLGTVTLWVKDVLAGSVTGGPTINGTNSANAINFSIENGATAATAYIAPTNSVKIHTA